MDTVTPPRSPVDAGPVSNVAALGGVFSLYTRLVAKIAPPPQELDTSLRRTLGRPLVKYTFKPSSYTRSYASAFCDGLFLDEPIRAELLGGTVVRLPFPPKEQGRETDVRSTLSIWLGMNRANGKFEVRVHEGAFNDPRGSRTFERSHLEKLKRMFRLPLEAVDFHFDEKIYALDRNAGAMNPSVERIEIEPFSGDDDYAAEHVRARLADDAPTERRPASVGRQKTD